MKTRENKLLIFTITIYGFGCTLSGIVFADTICKVQYNIARAIVLSLVSSMSVFLFSTVWETCVSTTRIDKTYAWKQLLCFAAIFLTCCLFSMDLFYSLVIGFLHCGILLITSRKMIGCNNINCRQSRRVVIMPPLFFCSVQSTCLGVSFSLISSGMQPYYAPFVYVIPLSYCVFWIASLKQSTKHVKRWNAVFVSIFLLLIVWYYSVVLFSRNQYFIQEKFRNLADLISFSFVYSIIVSIPELLEITQIMWKKTDIGNLPGSDTKTRDKKYRSRVRTIGGISMIGTIIVHLSWVLLEYSAYFLFIYVIESCFSVIMIRSNYTEIINKEKNASYHGSWGWVFLWALMPAVLLILNSARVLPEYYLPDSTRDTDLANIISATLGAVLGGVFIKKINLQDNLQKIYSSLGFVGFHSIGLGISLISLYALPFQQARKNAALFLLCVEFIILLIGYFISSQKPEEA